MNAHDILVIVKTDHGVMYGVIEAHLEGFYYKPRIDK